MRSKTRFALIVIVSLSATFPCLVAAAAIDIAEIKHEGPVDFSSEILPILRKKCLACHNQTDAESDLILESPAAMLKGGSEGPAIIPGNASESYLMKLAAHQDEPVMPPEDNEADAANLTPDELGLLALWINEGAKAGSKQQDVINWQSLPLGVNPILAVVSSSDGSVIAAGRANQVFVNHVSGIEFGRLTDPEMMKSGIYEHAGVAHLDMVHAIAMSPDNRWLATGGYRTIKIWQQDEALVQKWAGLEHAPTAIIVDGANVYCGQTNGSINHVSADTGETLAKYTLHDSNVLAIGKLNDETFASASTKGQLVVWTAAGEKITDAKIDGLSAMVAAGPNQIVITQADSKIHTWTFDSEAKSLTETGTMEGHSDSISQLAYSSAKNRIATAANDKITLYDLSTKQQIRQWAHGATVTRLAFASDSTRLASVGENGVIRVWNAEDGKPIAEFKAAPDTQFAVAQAKFQLDVANRQVSNSKKDHEDATKRQKQEEDNLKKSEENHKKADEDKKKKDEVATKTETEKQQAAKDLNDLESRIAAAEKTIQEGPGIVADAAKKYQQTLAQFTKPQADFEAALAAETTAKISRDEAKSKLDADKENAELKKAFDEAEKNVNDLTTKRAAAEKTRDEVFAVASESNSRRTNTLKAIEDSKTQLENDKKELEPKKKSLADKTKAAENGDNDLKAAIRTLESAANSIEQAKKAIERSKEVVGEKEKALAAIQAVAKQKDDSFKATEKLQNEFRFKVRAVEFSPDSKMLAIANEDGSICVWAAVDGSPIRQFSAEPASPSSAIAFTNAGQLLSADDDNSIRLWNAKYSWSLHHTIGSPDGESPLSDRVTSLVFTPDSKVLGVGGGQPSRNGELKLFSVADGVQLKDYPETHSDTVFGIAFSPDGKLMASCAADRFMKVTDLESGKVIKTFEGHTHHVLAVSWQADGRVLATAGADKVVKLWNFEEGSQIRTISGFGKEVTSLRHFGPNDSFVAVSGDQSIYNCNSGGQRNGIGKGQDFLYCVSTSQAGSTIVFGGHDSIVRVIDEKGKVLANLEPPK